MAECRKKTEDVKNGIHKRSINEVEVIDKAEGGRTEAVWFIGELSRAQKKNWHRREKKRAVKEACSDDETGVESNGACPPFIRFLSRGSVMRKRR